MKQSGRLLKTIVPFAAMAAGCVAATDGGLPGEDPGTSTDSLRVDFPEAGLEEGSKDGLAVLAVVNDADLGVEDYVEMGLRHLTAASLVAIRDGYDGTPGTEDDESFEFLAEVDILPYTDPAAFEALLAYAKAHAAKYYQYSVFDEESCPGEALSAVELLGEFAPGAAVEQLGTLEIQVRSRRCHEATGCGEWSEPRPARSLRAGGSSVPMHIRADLQANAARRSRGYYDRGYPAHATIGLAPHHCVTNSFGTTCGGVWRSTPLDEAGPIRCGDFTPRGGPRHFYTASNDLRYQCNGRPASAEITVKRSCVRFYAHERTQGSGSYIHYQYAAVIQRDVEDAD